MTREILKSHRSHSWAALSGWSYIPTDAEIALWDRFEFEGRLTRKGWRPWEDKRFDPFSPSHMETETERRERLARREQLKRRFHITD